MVKGFQGESLGLCSSDSQITHGTLFHLLQKLKNLLEACRKGKGSLSGQFGRARVSCCLHQKLKENCPGTNGPGPCEIWEL